MTDLSLYYASLFRLNGFANKRAAEQAPTEQLDRFRSTSTLTPAR